MAHTYHQLTYHIVFSVKRRQFGLAPTFRPELFRYMAGILQHHDGHPILINGVEDHVHLLIAIPPSRTVSDTIRDIKSGSSKWIRELHSGGAGFEWQDGYSAFTVSYSHRDRVRAYIANQEVHHTRQSFRDEYLDLLRKHDIDFDSRFVMEREFFG